METHKEYYKLSDSTIELTKICSITIIEDYFDILAWLTFVVTKKFSNVDTILSVDSAHQGSGRLFLGWAEGNRDATDSSL